MRTKTKTAVLDAPVTVTVSVTDAGTAFDFGMTGEELAPLFYRRAAYMLPAEVIQAPMPTLTCRHLEKATLHLLQGREDQALLAFRRAVASGVDPWTIVKVALACHTENHREEAETALKRAVKYAGRDTRSLALVTAIATHLGYAL